MSKESAFHYQKITLALIYTSHKHALLASTVSRSTLLRPIAHMDMQMIQMIHTRSHCFSRTSPCASQRARRPLGWQHRKPLCAAKMPAAERLQLHDAVKRRLMQQPRGGGLPWLLLLSAGCARRQMILPHVKEEPRTLRPLPQRHRHSREHLSGSHASPEACRHSLLF